MSLVKEVYFTLDEPTGPNTERAYAVLTDVQNSRARPISVSFDLLDHMDEEYPDEFIENIPVGNWDADVFHHLRDDMEDESVEDIPGAEVDVDRLKELEIVRGGLP